MVIPEFILRATVGSALFKALEPYRVTEEQMPWPYQVKNPEGRPLHGDWFWFKDTPRRDCARRARQPYKVIEGNFTREYIRFDPNYPLSPGVETKTEDGIFYVLADRGGYGKVKYAAFIDGQWQHVFTKYTRAYDIPFLGRYRHSWYVGLHQDNHWADLMCWIEPFAMSFVKEI